jgi:DNA polymerase III alpha subunit
MRDVQESLQRLYKLHQLNKADQSSKSESRNQKQIPNPNPETSNLDIPSSSVIRDSSFDSPVTHHSSRITCIDLGSLEPWTDRRVWSLIASGNARAVHHIESPAMISLCKMCNVQDIDTLIAIVSVIRPGAANESKKMEFARRYQRLSPIHYPHPSLEPCLRSTFGLVVYEEHILQMCEAFAGLPPGRADILRRALGKGKTDIIAQIQTEFADCARKLGRTEPEIAEVWELVAGFKGYAFCKAHSTAYGVEAYQSAWLKLNHPAEFMAAVLTNGKGFYHPLVYVLECHRLRIPLLPPSINEPGPQFTVVRNQSRAAQAADPNAKCRMPKSERVKCPRTGPSDLELRDSLEFRHSDFGSCIRVPLTNIKGLTLQTKETILREYSRDPFCSLQDFVVRVQPLSEEMEALIRAGAFDKFGKPRTIQYWEFKTGRRLCNQRSAGRHSPNPKSKTQNPKQIQMPNPELPNYRRNVSSNLELQDSFGFPHSDFGFSQRLPSIPLSEPDRLQCLRWEEELLGYPVSGHPLELYPDIAWHTYCPINRLGKHIGQQIVTCGLVIEQRLFHQVTGEPMKFITITDWTGIIETELFARTYRSYGLNTIRYKVLEITATVEPFENNRGYTLRVLQAGKPRSLHPESIS